MPTAPTPHTPLPPAPDISTPATFGALADAFVAAQEPFGDEMDGLAANVYANAVEAHADAVATAADAIATGEDRVQTGLDRTAAAGSASTSAGWSATSTTSMAVGTGPKSLTVQTGKQFGAGTDIKVTRTSAPTTTYMGASVDTYDSGTGALTFIVSDATGSGTYTDWTVRLSGARGTTGTGITAQAVGFTLTGGTTPKTLTVDADATLSSLMGASADVVALALEVATLKGSSAGLSSGVSDAFEDATGVDASASTNETYDSTNDLYNNAAIPESAETLPAMTAANAPSGYVASGPAGINSSFDPWKAFDDVAADYFNSADATVPANLIRQTPTGLTLGAYALTAHSSQFSGMPADFLFQGSNNGSSWTTLDTQTGQSWTGSQRRVYEIAPGNRASYTYHRLQITTAPASYHMVGEIEFLQLVTPVMSLRSVAYTALSAPATAMITVAADLNGGVVNTDLIAYASRDNGATWTAVTLTVGRALADGTTIYSGTASIAAQPSGTNMKWRIDTSDDFTVDASAVVLQWS